MSERRATITTSHADAETATRLARALRPDNTEEMATTIDEATVETTIERATTGGLAATVDDYVVNLSVAADLTTDRHTDTHE
ncbi:KEOPS complex Pcc1-like subunit [Halorhabdus sp. CBA1104]|uniref:KEOPS complex subunit Pcc1 n=1 Tax=Halorhabdus sp. CBA1104 TaxID=1380432 RepID=UPI0012B1D333|nr:KEOPS complex subunit Pcc1 [Halorhabdus sp. CBA1104]QGN07487.1 KEOPS complex Pcc1-like subunit [Halorhabdus sp. CBA1104]